jgi:hypothetical protein
MARVAPMAAWLDLLDRRRRHRRCWLPGCCDSASCDLAALRLREPRLCEQREADAGAPQRVLRCGFEVVEPVSNRRPEPDRRRFLEVTHGHRRVGHYEPVPDRLREELRVEAERIAVALERDLLEHLAPVDAEARVELAEVQAVGEVQHDRQHPVEEILPRRHAAAKRFAPRADPVAEDHVADTALDEAHEVRDQRRVVLVVRVQHHDDVGAALERRAVEHLLIAAVAEIARVFSTGKPSARPPRSSGRGCSRRRPGSRRSSRAAVL